MASSPTVLMETERFLTRARKLLEEHALLSNRGDLPEWNMRAQSLLVFELMRRIKEVKDDMG